MLMMTFLPRNSANDTGRPSAADGSARVGKASPGLNPRGNGALRSQIGLGFCWSAAPAPRATTATAVDSNQMTLGFMMPSNLICEFKSRADEFLFSRETPDLLFGGDAIKT